MKIDHFVNFFHIQVAVISYEIILKNIRILGINFVFVTFLQIPTTPVVDIGYLVSTCINANWTELRPCSAP